jgi:very-short-patch-repair endonuclease
MKRSRARMSDSIEFERTQRRTANELVDLVWQMVRNRACCQQKFRREFPVPPYTVDFCCVELKLIIEVDGEPHLTAEGKEHDRVRDDFLRNEGYEILRISGYDVIRDSWKVRERIIGLIERRLKEQ